MATSERKKAREKEKEKEKPEREGKQGRPSSRFGWFFTNAVLFCCVVVVHARERE